MLVSLYKNASSKEPANVKMEDVINAIWTGKWEDLVFKARTILRDSGKEEYNKFKVNLPAVTWSGTFKERTAASLEEYSGYVVIDIDNIVNVDYVKKQLLDDPYVAVTFTSPSGNGVKILVLVDSEAEHHKAAFLHLQKYFEDKYLLKVDDSGKDVSRLCFISSDRDAIIKEHEAFKVDVRYGEVKQRVKSEYANTKTLNEANAVFDVCIKWIEKNMSYVPGSRNRFVHALACALNRCGVGQADAEVLISRNYDLEPHEINHCVKSAYFHNQHEHGTTEVKDIGIKEFKAPPYIANYTDDVVVNDIMQTTAMLFHHGVPKDDIYHIVGKVARYYKDKGYIDFERKSLGKIMNESLEALNKNIVEATQSLSLEYMAAEDVGNLLVDTNINERAIDTTFGPILMPGNFYGIIGVGGTYKSILAQFIAFKVAQSNKGALYINSEMSMFQFYSRLSLMTTGTNLQQAMGQGKINKGNVGEFIEKMKAQLNHKMFFVNGGGSDEENIIATVANIEAKHNTKIELVVIDGITQMASKGREEIPAAIANTEVCKRIASNAHDGAGIVVLGLMHISGDANKLLRDTGPRCRGGIKTTANMDGYFSTSLFVDPLTNGLENGDDIIYRDNKFYLRFVDKRSVEGITNVAINVGETLDLTADEQHPSTYEVKLERR